MRRVAGVWSGLVLAYLFAPIAVMAAFSFNDPEGRFNVVWRRFSLDAWRHPFEDPSLSEALWTSVRIGVAASVAAAVLGSMLALGLARRRFRGRGAIEAMVVLPLATPDIVLGSSLLSLFVATGVAPGAGTIFASHVMFSIAYVAVTVSARLRGMDPSLVEAAMDLGADEWRTMRRVTLPLVAPAIASGALLALALSVDDFTITLFVSGSRVTFPLFVWGAARVAVPPQINVLGTLTLLAALGCFALGALLNARRASRAPERSAQ